jgi:hypothetical protein
MGRVAGLFMMQHACDSIGWVVRHDWWEVVYGWYGCLSACWAVASHALVFLPADAGDPNGSTL